MDHWEGLKDAEWMWRRNNGLELTVLAPKEALDTIRGGHQPPAFVALEVLALGTLETAGIRRARRRRRPSRCPGATLQTVALHHYSGIDPTGAISRRSAIGSPSPAGRRSPT